MSHKVQKEKEHFFVISYRDPNHLEDHTVNKAGAMFKSGQRDGCCMEFKIDIKMCVSHGVTSHHTNLQMEHVSWERCTKCDK